MNLEEFDVILVGGGSSGCALAYQLSANPDLRILLLEAGGANKSRWVRWPIGYGKTFTDPRFNWMQYSSPDGSLSGEAHYMPRGKGLGGSSAINAMVYTRSFAQDYDDWGQELWNGKVFWRAFDELESRHGEPEIEAAGGLVDVSRLHNQFHPIVEGFAQAAQMLGLEEVDLVNPKNGYGDYRFTIHKGRRVSAKSAFLDPILKRKNLTVLTGAEVARVEFEEGRARTVVYRKKGSMKRARARDLIVLCAGAFHSPKILMNSGIGDRKALANCGIETIYHNPNVGKNLQDHVAVSYHYKASEPTLNAVFGSFWGRTVAGLRYLVARSGPAALSVNQMGAFVTSRPGVARPDFQMYFNPLSYDRNDDVRRGAKYPSRESGFILSFNTCRPESRGQVSLASSDPFDDPIIRPNYLSAERDQNDVLLGAQIVRAFQMSEALEKVMHMPMGIDLEEASAGEIYEDFLARAGTVFHPCGTAKMAAPAKGGVVDAALDVYGVEGLKIVDASVFPLIHSANTNAPAMALGWIAGARILKEYRESLYKAG